MTKHANRPARPTRTSASGRDRRQFARSASKRQRLAYESARIMSEEGVLEFERARRKAAERTGIADRRCWPRNDEIEKALSLQRQLFQRNAQQTERRQLLRQALEAMRLFAEFTPRLVGQLCSETVVEGRGVRLHLHAESSEEVVLTMLDKHIPWEQRESYLRYPNGEQRNHPTLSFVAGDTSFDLVILPHQARRSPPLSSLTERPERGLDVDAVAQLLRTND